MRDILISRRKIMSGALAAACLAPSARADQAALNFLVVGDWGQPHSPTQRAVAAAMARTAGEIGAQFVISTGDNFYDDGVRSVRDRQWRTSFEEVYADQALQIPWYVVLGNHDHRGSTEAQIAYTNRSQRWRMRAPYWRETMAGPNGRALALLFLDTTPIVRGDESTEQLAWLARELAAAGDAVKIVIGHHPLYSAGQHGPEPALQRYVLPLLTRHGVRAYFNGHEHNLEHIERDGMHFVCSGAGAEARASHLTPGLREAFDHPGFASVSWRADALDLAFWNETGAMVYRAPISVAAPQRAL